MPKATAVWLVENTTLTFDQIADFCKLHPLEVKGIADGEVAQGIKGLDPVSSNQITRDEIEAGQKDPNHKLRRAETSITLPEPKQKKKGPRYTPVSKRQDRPNAILWLVRNHPELKDAQIMRLVGTTKSTIEAVRNRTHWNAQTLQPLDPVTLGLTTQIDLDRDIHSARSGSQRGLEQVGAVGRQDEQEVGIGRGTVHRVEKIEEHRAGPGSEAAVLGDQVDVLEDDDRGLQLAG